MLSVISMKYKDKVKCFALPPEASNEDSQDFKRLVCLEFGIDPHSDVSLISSKAPKGIDEPLVVPINLELLHQMKLLTNTSGEYILKAYEIKKQQNGIDTKIVRFKCESQTQRRQTESKVKSEPKIKSEVHIEVQAAPRQQKPQNASVESKLPYNTVIAIFDYTARSITELTFKKNDHIVVEGQWDTNWWKGSIGEEVGYFPAGYVRGLELIEFEEDTTDPNDPNKQDFQDDSYFDGYSTIIIHHQMLTDTHRTTSYQNAVNSLSKHIKGKTVLDLGCGSGILSVFCAKAGAKHVYAVDASDIIRLVAKKVIRENNLEDKITTIQGKIEELELPIPKVDVIISEWMGTFLICESMISSALFARRKFLKPSGLMMPSLAEMYIVPICVDEYYNGRINYWKDVYGVDMECVVPLAKGHFFDKPIYDRPIKPDELMSDPCAILSIDMQSWLERDLEEMSQSFSFTIAKGGNMHGFGSWFDTWFQDCNTTVEKKKNDLKLWKEGAWRKEKSPTDFPIVLTTSPCHKITHWSQVMFIFHDPIPLIQGQVVSGTITITRHQKWRRHFDTNIHFKVFKTTASSSSSSPPPPLPSSSSSSSPSSSSSSSASAASSSPSSSSSINGKVLETSDFTEYDYSYDMWRTG